MTDEPTGYAVMCVHSTRRSRRDALPGARETRCEACRATILVSAVTVRYASVVELHLICTACAAKIAGPDEKVDSIIPGTVEALEQGGIPDGQAFLDGHVHKSVRELAATALRNSGGQG